MKKSERYFLEHVRGLLQMKQAILAILVIGCALVALVTWTIVLGESGRALFWACSSSIVGILAYVTLQEYEKKAKEVDEELGDCDEW